MKLATLIIDVLLIAIVVLVLDIRRRLCRQGVFMSDAYTQLSAGMKKVDDATNTISSTLTDLRNRVKTDMTPDEVTQLQAAIDNEATKLTGIAADPADPVPGATS